MLWYIILENGSTALRTSNFETSPSATQTSTPTITMSITTISTSYSSSSSDIIIIAAVLVVAIAIMAFMTIFIAIYIVWKRFHKHKLPSVTATSGHKNISFINIDEGTGQVISTGLNSKDEASMGESKQSQNFNYSSVELVDLNNTTNEDSTKNLRPSLSSNYETDTKLSKKSMDSRCMTGVYATVNKKNKKKHEDVYATVNKKNKKKCENSPLEYQYDSVTAVKEQDRDSNIASMYAVVNKSEKPKDKNDQKMKSAMEVASMYSTVDKSRKQDNVSLESEGLSDIPEEDKGSD